MPVIAVLNRKGGSGKSTLATNLASWLAVEGEPTMLGDTDRQRSARAWLERRPSSYAEISGWGRDGNKVFRPPPGTTHVVLDTPGALYDHELAKLLVWVDAVIVPIGPSIFDFEASVRFIEDLKRIPRINSKRCSIVTVGMRWSQEAVSRWGDDPRTQQCQLITVLQEHPAYPAASAQGLGIFDLPAEAMPGNHRAQWEPLFQWVRLQSKAERLRRQSVNKARTSPGCASSSATLPKSGRDGATSPDRKTLQVPSIPPRSLGDTSSGSWLSRLLHTR